MSSYARNPEFAVDRPLSALWVFTVEILALLISLSIVVWVLFFAQPPSEPAALPASTNMVVPVPYF